MQMQTTFACTYKCRNCGKSFTKEVQLYGKPRLDSSDYICFEEYRLIDGHQCTNDTCGIADLVGFPAKPSNTKLA